MIHGARFDPVKAVQGFLKAGRETELQLEEVIDCLILDVEAMGAALKLRAQVISVLEIAENQSASCCCFRLLAMVEQLVGWKVRHVLVTAVLQRAEESEVVCLAGL